MTTPILRLKRTDKSGQHLLLHVTQSTNKSLNLKFIATEHEHLYHAQIQDSSLKSLQANTYAGDLSEWKAILTYALLHESPAEATLPEAFQGLETVAAISGATVTITLRKNIDGITQRLGSIKLEQDDEKEEVSAFEWVDSAVSTSDALRAQLETLQTSITEQQDQVKRLTQQLDELVQAKKEHEEEMLKKFAVLINAKKLKIRDQQRLLAGAKVDGNVAEAVREVRAGRGRKAGKSRGGKRKGDGVEHEDANGDEVEVSEDDEMRQETPPRSADEATDDEDDLDVPVRTNGKGKGKAKAAAASRQTNDVEMDIDEEDEAPPPRRELPFQKANAQQTAKKPEPAANEEDDETDDEL